MYTIKKELFGILVLCIVLIMAISCSSTSTGLTHEVEPNDSFSSANEVMTNGQECEGAIDVPGDNDYYYFTGQDGNAYDVLLKWVSGTNLDLVGDWYAYDYNHFYTLDFNWQQENEFDTIYFTGLSGTCYLVVSNYYSDLGEYTISVNNGNSSSVPKHHPDYP